MEDVKLETKVSENCGIGSIYERFTNSGTNGEIYCLIMEI